MKKQLQTDNSGLLVSTFVKICEELVNNAVMFVKMGHYCKYPLRSSLL